MNPSMRPADTVRSWTPLLAQAVRVAICSLLLLGTIPRCGSGQSAAVVPHRLIVKFRSIPHLERTSQGIYRSGSPGLDRLLQDFQVDTVEPLVAPGGNREWRE